MGGATILRAEIIPFEPESGNADEGTNCFPQFHMRLYLLLPLLKGAIDTYVHSGSSPF